MVYKAFGPQPGYATVPDYKHYFICGVEFGEEICVMWLSNIYLYILIFDMQRSGRNPLPRNFLFECFFAFLCLIHCQWGCSLFLLSSVCFLLWILCRISVLFFTEGGGVVQAKYIVLLDYIYIYAFITAILISQSGNML